MTNQVPGLMDTFKFDGIIYLSIKFVESNSTEPYTLDMNLFLFHLELGHAFMEHKLEVNLEAAVKVYRHPHFTVTKDSHKVTI